MYTFSPIKQYQKKTCNLNSFKLQRKFLIADNKRSLSSILIPGLTKPRSRISIRSYVIPMTCSHSCRPSHRIGHRLIRLGVCAFLFTAEQYEQLIPKAFT